MRSRLLAYLFRLLLSRKDLRLQKLLSKSSAVYVNLQKSRQSHAYGTLTVCPFYALTHDLVPSSVVEVSFEVSRSGKPVEIVKRLLRLATDFRLELETGVLGRNDFFNIFGAEPVDQIRIKKIDRSPTPARPASVRLHPIASPNRLENPEIALDAELKQHFLRPRLYYKGDVISISRRDRFDNGIRLYSFKVETTISPSLIDRQCSVYQSSSIKGMVPYGGQVTAPELPGNLEIAVEKAASILQANDRLSGGPISLLICGPAGSGKRLVARGISSRTHRNLVFGDAYDLWNEAATHTEQRIKHLVTRAQSVSPSLLVISNCDVLAVDGQTSASDDRILGLLASEISRLTNAAILFTCHTKKLASVSPQIRSSVLYTVVLEPMSEVHRKEFFAKNMPRLTCPEKAAASTTGFVVAELNALTYDARCRAAEEGRTSPNWPDVEWAIDKRNSSFADAIGAPKIPTVSWEDVGGLDEAKQLIRESLDNNLRATGGLRRSGIILYGPPGCGKTLLAKAVATEYKIAFLSVKGPELLNKYVGQSEENLRNVFERARAAAPCVVFFDELDSLAPNRGRAGDSGGVMDRVVSQLLAELDALHHATNKVFVMAATNRADLLDPSLRTPGRFDKAINVRVGNDATSRAHILRAVARKTPLARDVKLDEIASVCPDEMSGAELYSVISNATMSALREAVFAIQRGEATEENANVLVHRRHLLEAVDYVRVQKTATV